MLPDSHSKTETTNFAVCLLLGTAYASSIGGMGTIIGTTPNVFVVSFVQEQLGREISFLEWMSFALPFVIVLLPLTWWLLTRWVYPLPTRDIEGAREVIVQTRAGLQPMGRPERLTLWVFSLTALMWISRPLLMQQEIFGIRPLAGLTDAGVAMLAAFALFVLPADYSRREFLMDWRTAVKVPWGILLLLGGGLALAAALTNTGFSLFLGSLASAFAGWPALLTTLAVVAIVVFLTELTSNVATTATFVPVLLAVAIGLGMPPLLLIIPAVLAASCAFMLPVATPPNAIVFGSGMLSIAQMCRVGFWLNLVAIGVITLMTYVILVPVLDIVL
jgi:sodium-dependent dicarboxylate transporter 2/3/5